MNELCERAKFINIRGEVEEGLLRVTPRVPGRPASELPREVPISTVDQPIAKGDRERKNSV